MYSNTDPVIPCEDCHKDWGHIYCGTCGGSGRISNPFVGLPDSVTLVGADVAMVALLMSQTNVNFALKGWFSSAEISAFVEKFSKTQTQAAEGAVKRHVQI